MKMMLLYKQLLEQQREVAAKVERLSREIQSHWPVLNRDGIDADTSNPWLFFWLNYGRRKPYRVRPCSTGVWTGYGHAWLELEEFIFVELWTLGNASGSRWAPVVDPHEQLKIYQDLLQEVPEEGEV